MPTFRQPLRQTTRRLARSPVFALFSIVTLALAIGATTAIFSVIHVVTGPPPGIPDVDRVLEVYHYPEGSGPIMNLAWEDYQDLRARQTVFEALTGWTFARAAIVANGQSETNTAEIVDGDYFRATRAPIVLGRALQPADDRPEAPNAVVISAAFHQRVFAGAPDVVGRTMKLGGTTFEIVGVVAPEFQGLFNGGLVPTAAWIPMAAGRRAFPQYARSFGPGERNHRWVMVRGRLAPDRTVAQARSQIQTIARQLDAESPLTAYEGSGRAPWTGARPWGVRGMGRLLGVPSIILRGLTWTLSGAVVLVLLIACTNLANLMVARHTDRRTELAIRGALGASRGRLTAEAMLEPIALAVLGGVAGLGVARALTAFFSTALSINGLTLQALPHLDWPALGVALIATLLAAGVAGVVPAWRATGRDLRAVLAAGSTGAAPRWRGRRYLIALQVSISVFLVSVGWLFVAQLRQQRQMEPGIDLDHLAIAEIDFETQQYDTVRARAIADATVRQIAGRPGVAASAAMSGLPFGLNTRGGRLDVPGMAPPDPSRGPIVPMAPGRAPVTAVAGDAQLFDALGVDIVDGRAFRAGAALADGLEAVVSLRAAAQLFPEGQAVGREVVLTRQGTVGTPGLATDTVTIVGLASDTDARAVGRRDEGIVYLPMDAWSSGHLLLVGRTSGDPAPAVAAIRQVLRSIDPELAVGQAGTGLALAGPDTMFPRVVASLGGALGVLALIVALAGLYGVLSHVVGSRTREIGIRMALGAGPSGIRRMVLVEGLSPVVLGLVAGLGLGAIARVGLRPVFQRLVPGTDISLFVVVPVLFVVAGLVACQVPARRASRVDPNVALRQE